MRNFNCFNILIASTLIGMSQSAATAQYVSAAPSATRQLTVASFTDVRPSDWAYQALSNLIENYGCVAGYSSGAFLGGRSITRYEAAALLNSCLDRIGEQTDELKRLLDEFSSELATIRARITGIETKVGSLEASQFSTTTRLHGYSTFYINGVAGTERAGTSAIYALPPSPTPPKPVSTTTPTGITTAPASPDQDKVDKQLNAAPLRQGVTFQYSQILSLATSFSGKDMLTVDLYSSNIEPISSSLFGASPNNTGTYLTRLSFDAPSLPSNNVVNIGDLYYRFQPLKNLNITIDAVSSDISSDFLGGNLPFITAYPYTQSISRFGKLDPIYYPYLGRQGLSADYKVNDYITIGAGYFGGLSNEGVLFGGTYKDPASPSGKLQRASQAAIAQISLWPTPKNKLIGFTFTYGKLTLPEGTPSGVTSLTGTAYADQPFGSVAILNPKTDRVLLASNTGLNSDTVGLGFGWHIGGDLYLSADTSYIRATATTSSSNPALKVRAGDHAGIFQWNASLAWNNLGGRGNVATLVVGNPYRVISHDSEGFGTQDTAPWHIELSYTYRLSDHVSIVPGFYYILNPEANSNNAPLGVFSLKSFINF
ncbi:MAG: iron uptake porin [Cyanobium sp.]